MTFDRNSPLAKTAPLITLPRMARVVVIDDEELVAESFATALRFAGHEVSVAHDGAAGLRLVTESLPEVVVSDITMPEMDGLAMTAALKAQPATARIPVLLISGNVQPEENACDAFLTKPVNIREMLATVQRLAEKR